MQTIPVLLLDAGTGNLHSVFHTLRCLDAKVTISSDPQDLHRADRVILPGVGAFARFMQGLHKQALDQAILQFIANGKPLLGICVGMQALFEYSLELGQHPGLGILKGIVQRFTQTQGFKIPHTGWNQLWFNQPTPMLNHINPGDYAYFNHSFYCAPENKQINIIETDYCTRFSAAVQYKNVFAVQFHPEKSQKVGQTLLQNFLNWEGEQ